jgi:glycosyltransferase involved in cell wall biosynthesis
VLITPARNEEACIERTIESVINQTLRPSRYVIVSDGSIDNTDAIAKRYAARHGFVEFVRRDDDPQANFRSKVLAFNLGLKRMKGIQYDFVGNLDADISLEPDYFKRLLDRFEENPNLGIAGGQVWEEKHGALVMHNNRSYSVAGAVMLFRRGCYEAIGGYVPLVLGGEDSSAEIMARAKGWTVLTFRDIRVVHNKPLLSQNRSLLESRFKQGISNYLLGYHPLFQAAVCVYRLVEYPCFTGALFLWAGFCWAKIKRMKWAVPQDVVRFIRREQLGRLAAILTLKNTEPL